MSIKRRLDNITRKATPYESNGSVEMLLTDSGDCVGYRYKGKFYADEKDIPRESGEGFIFFPVLEDTDR
jgi:hypothetical protein